MIESGLRPSETSQRAVRRENVSFGALGQSIQRSTPLLFHRRSIFIILLSALVSLALAIGYLAFAPAVYTARAQLLIDLKLPQFLQGATSEPGYGLDSSQLESHIVLLQSERVATVVINKLGLLQDELQVKPSFWANLLGTATSGGELQTAIERFEDRLQVRRIGLSYAVEVAFSSYDPAKSAAIANATIESYLQSLMEFRAEAARVAVQSNSYTVSNVHLVSKALAPNRKSWPKNWVVITLALTFGTFIGACFVLIRDVLAKSGDSKSSHSR